MGTSNGLKKASIGTAGFILVGVIVCALPALLLGTSLGYYPSRMVCTPETGYGSGCYEGDLEIALFLFALFFLPWAGISVSATVRFRQELNPVQKWWPVMALCTLTALIIGAATLSGLLKPDEYF